MEQFCLLTHAVDSAPSLGVYYFLSLTLSACMYVCMYVCLSRSFKSILLFCFSVESNHCWAVSSPCGTLQNVIFDFWFRPPNPKISSPKFWHKIAYNSACTADRTEIFAPTRGFSGMGPTLVAIATTFGLGAESNRLPVCLFVCLSVNTITPEPLERYGYHYEIFRASSYGWKGEQVRKWLYIGVRGLWLNKRFWCYSLSGFTAGNYELCSTSLGCWVWVC